MVDPEVDSSGIARNRELQVLVQVDGKSEADVKTIGWLIGEGSIQQPSPQDFLWTSSPPSSYLVSPGDGPKSVDLWLKNQKGKVAHAAQFLVLLDTTLPQDPSGAFSPSHHIGTPSTNNLVTVQWEPARDPEPGSGLAGYSTDWNQFPNTVPDPVLDLDESVTEATSPPLEVGTWYLHLSTLDRAGNHTTTVHVGPFIIADSSLVQSSSSAMGGQTGSVSGNSPGGVSAGGPGNGPGTSPGAEGTAPGIDQPKSPQPLEELQASVPPAEGPVAAAPAVPSNNASAEQTGNGGGTSGADGGGGSPVTGDSSGSSGGDGSGGNTSGNGDGQDSGGGSDSGVGNDGGDGSGSGDGSGGNAGDSGGSNSGGGNSDDDDDGGSLPIPPPTIPPPIQSSVRVSITGDAVSNVGDVVSYTYTITNNSPNGTPALILDSLTDTLLGNLSSPAIGAGCGTLIPGGSCSFKVSRQVRPEDQDPLLNTVTANYHSQGFGAAISDADSYSVDLFQPSVAVEVTGDTTSQVGDDVTYTYTITNNSSAGAPDLLLVSITDDLLGDLASAADGCDVLASGESCSFDVSRQVQAGDPDPLVNTVEVHYQPEGFTNDIADADSHSIRLTAPPNSPPIALDDLGLYSVNENVTLNVDQVSGVLANDDDPDGDSITALLISVPSNGLLTLNADGSFTYEPDTNFNGIDSFTYQANDGASKSTSTATAEITVDPVNQRPIADSSALTILQDTPATITLTGSDVETAAFDLSFVVVTPPQIGSLSGLAPDLTYTPTLGVTGSDSFTFTVADRGDPDGCSVPAPDCSGPLTSAVATISIDISPGPGALMTDVVVGNGKTYQLGTLQVGEQLYTDRNYVFTKVPGLLEGQQFIRTANKDKIETADNHLTFDLSVDARVFILFDARVDVLPAWLDDGTWTQIGIMVGTSDMTRIVYFKDFTAGPVQLGGNAMPPMSGAESNYNVVVIDALSMPGDVTPPFIAITSHVNDDTVNTSSITVAGNASDDSGAFLVEVMLNGGAFQPASGTSFWSRDLNLITGINTITARVTDAAGNSVHTSVSVTFDPLTLIVNVAVANGKTYEVDVLEVGQLVYIDRDYEFIDVPSFLAGQEFIRTANNDKDAKGADHLTFDLLASARVYVLFDDRAHGLPAWLDDGIWTLDSTAVGTSDVLRRVYFKDFPASTVQLGGNAMPPMSGAESNYNVAIVPSTP